MPLAFDWLPQAIFFDRDGTLIEHVHYLSNPDEVRLISGISSVLEEAKDWGCRLFLHTNQSGVGRGYFTMDEVNACNDRMHSLVGLGNGVFDAACIATESPDDESPEYRKPLPKFEYEMRDKYGLDLSRCVVIGDRECDVQTGINAGMNSIGIWRMGDDDDRRQRFEELGADVYSSVAVYWEQLKAMNSIG